MLIGLILRLIKGTPLTHIEGDSNTTILSNAIEANTQSISNLSGATGSIVNETLDLVTNATAQQMSFTVDVASNNVELLSFNDANDTITLKADLPYNFYSTFEVLSDTNEQVTLTFEVRKSSDNSVIKTITNILDIPKDQTKVISRAILLNNVGVNEVYLTVRSDVEGYIVKSIDSIISVGSTGGSGGADVNYIDVNANYTVQVDDYINLKVGGFTLTLPTTPEKDEVFHINTSQDVEGNTVVVEGGTMIMQGVVYTTLNIDTNGLELKFKFDGTIWEIL